MSHQAEPRHNLRLSPQLKQKLAHARADSGRSMNAEIVERLEKSFAPDSLAVIANVLEAVSKLDEDDRKKVIELFREISRFLDKE